MDRFITSAKLSLTKVDPRFVKLVLLVISLVLFVLGAGAPAAGGGIGQ
jgi:hypothetical protein